MVDDVAIKVEHASKTFKLPHQKQNSIKGALISLVHGKKSSYEKQRALQDISFEVKKGEFFGIVGKNGGGKSTLLKLLAGIYAPTSGKVWVNGKLTPFIELGVGFNPELTGRENVYLNGALLGFSRKEMQAMYAEIVDFAEIERFMDQKLKNYSSGMQVRLAFSIAIRAQSDILLIDEVLAVGDAAFQQKCYDTFSQMKKTGRTLVLVTHDMSAILRFCDRALLIHNGKQLGIGAPKDIADKYLELNYEETQQNKNVQGGKSDTLVKIDGVVFEGAAGAKKSFVTNQSVPVGIHFKNDSGQPLHFGFQIFNEAESYCFGTNTRISGLDATTIAHGTIKLALKLELTPGNYSATVAIMNEDATKVVAYKPDAISFRIAQSTKIEGIANLPHQWSDAHV